MKNMKLMDDMKQGVAKVLGNVAMKVGGMAIDTQCIGWNYEPEIPQELLKNKVSEK